MSVHTLSAEAIALRGRQGRADLLSFYTACIGLSAMLLSFYSALNKPANSTSRTIAR